MQIADAGLVEAGGQLALGEARPARGRDRARVDDQAHAGALEFVDDGGGFRLLVADGEGHAIGACNVPLALRPAALQRQPDAREAEAAEPVEQAGERIGLLVHADPVRVGERGLRDAEQVEDRDDQHQRGVLHQRDELVGHRGQRNANGLRQHDEAGRAPVAEAQRGRGLVLAFGHRLQAAAHGFRHVGGDHQAEPDHGAREAIDADARRHDQRQQDRGEENHRDDRHAAPELDEDHRDHADHRQLRLAPEREQDAERDRDQAGIDRDENGEHQPAPFARLDVAQAEAAGEQPDAERRQHDEGRDRESAAIGERLPRQRRDADDEDRRRRDRRASARPADRART